MTKASVGEYKALKVESEYRFGDPAEMQEQFRHRTGVKQRYLLAVYEEKGKVKIGSVYQDLIYDESGQTFYSGGCKTWYEPATGRWWNHKAEYEELIKSGRWRELPSVREFVKTLENH